MALSEHKEQVTFIHKAKKYLREQDEEYLIPLLFAIPNGGKRDARTASSMKMEGVRKGVPDLLFAYQVNDYAGLFIEMKVRKGGRVSPEQKQMMKLLEEEGGYKCVVARGWEEAINFFKEYLEGEAL